MENPDNNKQSGYDQKAFLQIRLHELLTEVDMLNYKSAGVPPSIQASIQRAIFNNLSSVFSTIYSKLTPAEQEVGKSGRKEINDAFANIPVSRIGIDRKTHKYGVLYSAEAVQILSEGLFNFRFMLEGFMDKHGFNPSKKDNSTSIVD